MMSGKVVKIVSDSSAGMYSVTRAASYLVSFLHSSEQYHVENIPGGKIVSWIIGLFGSTAIVVSTTSSYGKVNQTVYNQLSCIRKKNEVQTINANDLEIAPINQPKSLAKYYSQESFSWAASLYCTYVMTSSSYRFLVNALGATTLAYFACSPIWLLVTSTLLSQYSTQTANSDPKSASGKIINLALSLTRLGEINTARLANLSNVTMFLDTCRKLLITYGLMEAPISLGWGIVLGLMSFALYVSNNQSYAERLKNLRSEEAIAKIDPKTDNLYFENALMNTPILGNWIILPLASSLKAGTGLLGIPDSTVKFMTDFNLVGNKETLEQITFWTRVFGFSIPAVPSLITMLAYFKASSDKKTDVAQPNLKTWITQFNLFSKITDNPITCMCCKSKNLLEELKEKKPTERTPLIYEV